MALAITCSQCNKGYRVPNDAAGRAIKCRQCGTRIPVPSPEAPASEDDFFGLLSDAVALEQELEALPERRHAKSGTSAKPRTSGNGSPSTKKANQRGLLHVAKGLSIIRIAVVIRTVVFLLALTLSLIPDAILRTLPIGIWPVLNWTSLVGSIVGKLLMLAGLLLCISATPAKAKARALLIVAAFFEITGACFSEFVGLFAGRLPFLLLAFLGILGGLISQAALLPLLVYVKMLSCFIRYKSGEDDVTQLFVLVGVLIGLPALLGPLARVPGLGDTVGILGGIAHAGIALTVLVRFVELLTSVRNELSGGISR